MSKLVTLLLSPRRRKPLLRMLPARRLPRPRTRTSLSPTTSPSRPKRSFRSKAASRSVPPMRAASSTRSGPTPRPSRRRKRTSSPAPAARPGVSVSARSSRPSTSILASSRLSVLGALVAVEAAAVAVVDAVVSVAATAAVEATSAVVVVVPPLSTPRTSLPSPASAANKRHHIGGYGGHLTWHCRFVNVCFTDKIPYGFCTTSHTKAVPNSQGEPLIYLSRASVAIY